jgi:glutathione S-transferase
MITLYNFHHGARGVRVAWVCEEMCLDYQMVTYDYPTPAEFHAKYPLGVLPFIEDKGGVAFGESVAHMLYLVQRYGPTPLLPVDPKDLAVTLQITVASEATLGGLMNPMMGTKFGAPEDKKANWTNSYCAARVAETVNYLESLLDGRDFFVGPSLTLADIAVATALDIWKGALGGQIPPGLADHRDRMRARPAYRKASNPTLPA